MREENDSTTRPLHPISRLVSGALSTTNGTELVISPANLERIQHAIDCEQESDGLLDAVETLMKIALSLESAGSIRAARSLTAIATSTECRLLNHVSTLKGRVAVQMKQVLSQFRAWSGDATTDDAFRAPHLEDAPPPDALLAGSLAEAANLRAARAKDENSRSSAPRSARTPSAAASTTRRRFAIDPAH